MKVRYTRSAARQLDAILTYIEERSPQGSQSVKARIHEVINLISFTPFIGRPTRSRSDIRRFNAQPYPYIVFYSVTEAEIIIRSIRHMSRKPE